MVINRHGDLAIFNVLRDINFDVCILYLEIINSLEFQIWSAEHERDFLRTLSALKTHDPRLYSGQKFFTAENKGLLTLLFTLPM